MINNDLVNSNNNNLRGLKFIDLFAGLGGTRIGFESACKKLNIKSDCVFTSEIKKHAIKAYSANFSDSIISGDITKINADSLPDFDVLLAGFPCQSFSYAGKGLGFLDTRGTLFFDIERILRAKLPKGFILENVGGLVTHDRINKTDKIGRTLETILGILKNIGYKVNWKVLDSKDFGVPQSRKRIYIVGNLHENIDLDNFERKFVPLKNILQVGQDTIDSHFTRCLLKKFEPDYLHGKSIKDKRGGENNIHSWQIGLKGEISNDEINLIEKLFKERRKY
jgi:DNA (cytosine-5)-methyltransferase 1